MKICIFGTYDRNYSRNAVIIKGLLQNSVELVEVQEPTPHALKTAPWTYLIKISQALLKLAIQLQKVRFDGILVLYPGILAVGIAKFISNKPIIFDPFISIYEANVGDYHSIREKSLKARIYYWLERRALHKADFILTDTNQHQLLYRKLFQLTTPMERIFVGADPTDLLKYKQEKSDRFNSTNQTNMDLTKKKEKLFQVCFIGTYIPLQGIEYIIESASFLGEYSSKIHYTIIGGNKNQQAPYKQRVRELGITNIKFIDPMPYAELSKWADQADLHLGIFGKSLKTLRVIPNKAFYAIAAGKPLLTSDSPGIRELFTPHENIFLCAPASSQAIADAIIEIYKNEELRTSVAKNGHQLFYSTCTPKIIGAQLKSIIDREIITYSSNIKTKHGGFR